MGKYARTLTELKAKAVLFWPPDLIQRQASVSILPLLIKTQDKFISVLKLSDASPDAWKRVVDVSEEMQGNVFLKHLMVLSDLGGEALNKLPPLSKYFQDGRMIYVWRENHHEYKFQVIHDTCSLQNTSLYVSAKHLLKGHALNQKMEDVIMLLLHGAASIGDTLPESEKEKCMIGSLIGNPDELEKFVKESYIRISSQLRGATSNAMGQLAQSFVIDALERRLPHWKFQRNGTLPNVSHTSGKTETTFDVVAVSPNEKYFGIEVSFQYTTNSVIERKAQQAAARQEMIHEAGHNIAYVLDGAGNINIRERAVSIICDYSDCTVALSTDEIGVLTEFMENTAGSKK